MALSTCPRCKKIFDKVRTSVCGKCQPDEDADFDKVRQLLERSPNLNAEQAAHEADVTVGCVMRMMDEGLISNTNLTEKVKCGRCGAPAISMSKKLCQACLEKLNSQVAQAQSKIKLSHKKDVQVGEYLHARKAFDEKHQ